jgi:hypothetical protein
MASTLKKTLIAVALGAGLAALAGQAMAQEAAKPADALTAEARGIVGKFAEKLKGELVGAMKSEGPVKAIAVCNTAAPAIAKEVSADGWTVNRTSLKLRNASAAPDAWEKAALEFFEAEKAKGADPMKLERSEVVEKDGKKTFRYMKAIPTAAEPCLACHGGDIKEPVKAKLTELYPKDEAVGYKEGDIRGAFSLSKPQ